MAERTIGWTVSETIGVAVINPRAVAGVKIMDSFHFGNELGSIEIREHSIEIKGSLEAAAKAMAEAILEGKRNRKAAGINTFDRLDAWNYFTLIKLVCCNDKYTIDLTKNGRNLINPERWGSFKRAVEKICNDLAVFL